MSLVFFLSVSFWQTPILSGYESLWEYLAEPETEVVDIAEDHEMEEGDIEVPLVLVGLRLVVLDELDQVEQIICGSGPS